MTRCIRNRTEREKMRWTITLLAYTLVMSTVPSLSAQRQTFEFPDTPVGKRASDYFAAFNSNDPETIRQFARAQWTSEALKQLPAQEQVTFHQNLWQQARRLTPHSILVHKPQNLAILAHSEEGDMWLKVELWVAPEPPHKLTGLQLLPSTPPELAKKKYDDWKTLKELLATVCQDAGSPGGAAAVIAGDKIVDQAVWGTRQFGKNEPIHIDDRFHIGSVTKSMTATMIATLIEQKKINWNTTVGSILKDVEMLPQYRHVTVEQLLQHRAGIEPQLTFNEAEMNRLVNLPGTPTEQRTAYLKEVLQMKPVARPGEKMIYSNAGYALAAHLAEQVTGKSWQQLIRETVFEPLGLKTAGFGWPATTERPSQPKGHYGTGSDTRVQKLDEYPLGSFLAPAGDVHCSIGDFARYVRVHLKGLKGKDGHLKAKTIKRLHTPPTATTEEAYAGGWMITRSTDGEMCHWHNGSAGTFYSLAMLYPESDQAFVVVFNSAGPNHEQLATKMIEAIRKR